MIKDCPICKERYMSSISIQRVTFAEYMKGCLHQPEAIKVVETASALSEAVSLIKRAFEQEKVLTRNLSYDLGKFLRDFDKADRERKVIDDSQQR